MSINQICLSVPGMHCPSCPKLIEMALLEISGVLEVTASLDTKTVSVVFDSGKISTSQLIASLKEIGYIASLDT